MATTEDKSPQRGTDTTTTADEKVETLRGATVASTDEKTTQISATNAWQTSGEYVLGLLELSITTPVSGLLKMVSSPDVAEWAERRYTLGDPRRLGRNPHVVLVKMLGKIPNEVLEKHKSILQKLMHAVYTSAPETLSNCWRLMGELSYYVCDCKPIAELTGWQLSVANILTNREPTSSST